MLSLRVASLSVPLTTHSPCTCPVDLVFNVPTWLHQSIKNKGYLDFDPDIEGSSLPPGQPSLPTLGCLGKGLASELTGMQLRPLYVYRPQEGPEPPRPQKAGEQQRWRVQPHQGGRCSRECQDPRWFGGTKGQPSSFISLCVQSFPQGLGVHCHSTSNVTPMVGPHGSVSMWYLMGIVRQKPGNWAGESAAIHPSRLDQHPMDTVLGGCCLQKNLLPVLKCLTRLEGALNPMHCVTAPSKLSPVQPCDQRNKEAHAQKACCGPALGLFIPSCRCLIESSPQTGKACIIILIYQKASLRLREVECLAQGHTAFAWQRQVSSAVFPITLECIFLD